MRQANMSNCIDADVIAFEKQLNLKWSVKLVGSPWPMRIFANEFRTMISNWSLKYAELQVWKCKVFFDLCK